METYEAFFANADRLGVKLTDEERVAAIRMTAGPHVHRTRLEASRDSLLFAAELFESQPLRTDAKPAEAIYDAACAATDVDWSRRVLVALLAWRWDGVGELRIAAELIGEEIERRKGAAA